MRKLAYIKLNRQAACPPRAAVPVNQRMMGGSFTRHAQFAFGHGGDQPGYVNHMSEVIPLPCQI